MWRIPVFVILGVASGACWATLATAAAPAVGWSGLAGLPTRGVVTAVATDPTSGRLAVADTGGVWLRSSAAERPARVLRRAPVTDLRFLADGRLLAATDRGVFAVASDGRSVRRLGSASGSRGGVRRFAVSDPWILVAGVSGVRRLDPDGRWHDLTSLGSGTATAVAVEPAAPDTAARGWAIVEGRVEAFRLDATGTSTRLATDPALTRLSLGREARDLAQPFGDAELAVLAVDRLLLRRRGRWSSRPLPLPPGAEAQRLAEGAGGLWIATDRALLGATLPEGPWRRAAPPAGGAAILALAGTPQRIYAVGSDGVLVGTPDIEPVRRVVSAGAVVSPVGPSTQVATAGSPGLHDRTLRSDPPIAAVQRAALRHLELAPEAIRRLRRGVARRGWWPALEIDASYSHDRRSDDEHDEVFSSGALRRLHDHGRDRSREYALGIRLAWDFGDLAYHPEEIDVSREAREVIELRDDVLDEVNQLYFARQRALDALAARPAPPPEERNRLGLQADELAAGLDAWTGGWFGEQGSGARRRRAGPQDAVSPLRGSDRSPREPGLENRP